MINFVQGGRRLPYTNNGSAITSGQVIVLNSGGGIGGMNLGIAVDPIPASGGTGILQNAGVFSLPKNAGEVFTPGQNLYWNGTALTGTSSGNTWAGSCYDSNGDASAITSANVLLNNQPY